MVRWGLVPHWAKDLSIGARMINARAETVAEKPSFREPFKKRRCLVVADGYYEWQKVDGKKLPWRYTLADGGLFAFAGLWSRWDKAADGVPVETCCLITTEANQLARRVHDRMPVILAPDDYEAWLGENSVRDVADLLGPYPADAMRAYRVSTVVSNARNDVPECIEPTDELVPR
jgi:putative SOS response-associated peptidase YedK